jgi:hypothetical protein
MNKTMFVACGLWICGFAMFPLYADETANKNSADTAEVTRVAALIDACIEERLAEAKVTAAPIAEDAEFLRRVYLDVAGRIPTVQEVRTFLEDDAIDKRRNLVFDLLEGPRYPIHFARRWRAIWLPPSNTNPLLQFQQFGFENWLRLQFADDNSYSRMVAALLTLPNRNQMAPNDLARLNNGSSTAFAFFGTRQFNRDDTAAAVARTMLGVRIECAQCHDHPFDAWTQDQFHSFAALFDGVTAQPRNVRGQVQRNRPSTAKPVFLDGSPAVSSSVDGYLSEVTRWMIAPENKYFARAAVNRIWQNFFGVGIVDPVDDFSDQNPPSHPRLLDNLAHEFRSHNFNLKFIIRSITASRAYQRTSRHVEPNADSRLFVHSQIRALTAEQLWDSLEQLAGLLGPREGARELSIVDLTSPRAAFQRLFDTGTSSSDESSTTILQALALMNGPTVTAATTYSRGVTLTAIADFPGLSPAEKIETIYLATLSRMPRPEELNRSMTYVTEGSNAALLSDLLWALLNSSEFVTNH